MQIIKIKILNNILSNKLVNKTTRNSLKCKTILEQQISGLFCSSTIYEL